MSTSNPPAMSHQARSELILAHLPRVRWIAARIHERLARSVSLEDLVSIGVLGLIAAIDRFDARLNVKLTTYADYRIRGSILDSVRDLGGVPAHKRPKLKMIVRATAAAAQRLKAFPDHEQIAGELGIPLRQYHQWLLEVRPHSVTSLDDSFEVGPHRVTLADVLRSDSGLEPDQMLEGAELRQLLDRAFSSLPPAQYRVMSFYYREGLRIQEIAGILGLHASRVWQMKNKATAYVRDFVQAHWRISPERKSGGSESHGRYAALAD